MFWIGRTIRSAKMKAITPPKLMPPFHNTAASGILPTEQTNEMTATSGPTMGPHRVARSGWSTMKNDRQNSSGTQAASAPAMRRPPTMSSQTEAQSRAEAALPRIQEGTEPIDIVARKIGFGDKDRMRRAFLRIYGQPPRALRRAT